MNYYIIKFNTSTGIATGSLFADSEKEAKDLACLQFNCKIKDIVSCENQSEIVE